MADRSSTPLRAVAVSLLVLAVGGIWLLRKDRTPAELPFPDSMPAEHSGAGGSASAPAVEEHPDAALAQPAPEGGIPPLPPADKAAAPPPSEAPRQSEPFFAFPTANQGLLQAKPEQFFMFVDRYTPQGQIQVWQGGDYGFVRNPRQTPQGTVYTKFHEGIDIAPAARDGKGEPMDDVLAIADGTVVYITSSPRSSNYGHYVVVLHDLGKSGVFYSLYAHLRSISAVAGAEVKRGGLLGKMGYTGDGLDRRRAHVHLEIGLMLSERFDLHYGQTSALPNGHGNFHGSNLIGMNAGAFLTAHHTDPALMPDQFLKREEVYFKVTVPNRGQELEMAGRYPWLRGEGAASVSWEISLTGPGVPVSVVPSSQAVAFPSVTWVKPFAGYHSWNTRSLLGGSGNTATLTAQGQRFMTLVTGDF